MTRRAAYACAVALAFLGVLGLPASSVAAPAKVPHIELHLSRTVVVGGDPVTVTARANALCDWIVTFHGERRHTIARSIRTTFVTPEVDHRTRLNIVVTCVVHTPPGKPKPVPPAANSGSRHDAQALVVRIPAAATVDPPLTIVPGGIVEPPKPPHHPGGLPNTGGPALWLVLAGLLALLAGAVTVQRSLRRGPVAFAVERLS
ncbi:LPXTG cell wall anchor domain-containing protein [Nocardioides marmorisolisilvae]|uniref:LPXTG cell wall anchor domain-containing protein n=1 Tax=Nocardioides marmorisolisilvae TaxID=1542737 RepID=A0A3N0DZC4_9ACTN|nr:LPXTG cell wall anchor domain-containing protein [Nocardioides marmorisolisilvae]RNL80833.1 LPXTG cell wall anchor domain-containing protein [Nocardioides marmorisolisilvae]